MTERLKAKAADLSRWWHQTIETTRGGAVLIVAGFIVLTSANLLAIVQGQRLADKQIDDVRATVALIDYQRQVREFQLCEDTVHSREELRATFTDLFDGVAAFARTLNADQLVDLMAEQGRLLDERRPVLTIEDDCPPEPRLDLDIISPDD